MTYNFIIEQRRSNEIRATVQGWPDCTVTAATREEAMASLRDALLHRLSKVEVVPVEIDVPETTHPWMKFAGMYEDEPLFDAALEEIATYRRELDAGSK